MRDPRLKEYLRAEMGEYQGQEISNYSMPPIVKGAGTQVPPMSGGNGDMIIDTEILQ